MPTWPRKLWQEMTTVDFADIEPRTIAVLPVGAIEQHGPHLPVGVDACICERILLRALDRLPADLPVTALPMQAVGKSVEHLSFPGTLTLSTETLIRLWTEIGESVARAGISKLVLLNSHGGQPQVTEIVARDLRVRLGMLVVAANWWDLVEEVAAMFPADELRHGIHAGSIETSLVMHLAPDLVRRDELRDFRPTTYAMDAKYRLLGAAKGAANFAWMAEDLHESGACGNALDADAERGRRIADLAADAVVELLREVDAFEIPGKGGAR